MSNAILGRAIEGDISHYSEDVLKEQYSEERFLELLDAVFAADPRVAALGWNQYTPYFNDGEACVFRVWSENLIIFDQVPEAIHYDVVRFEGEDDDADAGYGDYEGDPRVTNLSRLRPKGNYGTNEEGTWTYLTYPGEVESELYKAAKAFYSALDGGNFRNVVLTHFGDPATVIATREGFKVEFYDHD